MFFVGHIMGIYCYDRDFRDHFANHLVDCASASDGAGPRKLLADATAGSVVSFSFLCCL